MTTLTPGRSTQKQITATVEKQLPGMVHCWVCFSRGQCIPPFHCSIVCSLSSSCLSEIWGGGCETKGNTHVRGRSHTAAALIKFTTNWGEQLAHRVGLCRVVPHVNVGVIKSFFYRYAALGINDQHFGKQIPCLTCCYDNTGRAGLLLKQAYDIIKFKYSFWQLNIVPDGVGEHFCQCQDLFHLTS